MSSNNLHYNSNGRHHHQHNTSTVSNITTSDFPVDVLRNDELAANLIKCATYVKLGETHHPLLQQTIQDLCFFVTGENRSPMNNDNISNSHSNIHSNSNNNPVPVVSGGPLNSQPSPASSVLSKKTVSNLVSGVTTKLGLHNIHDDHSSIGSSAAALTDAQKAASSMKNAESARADIQRALGTAPSSPTGKSSSTRILNPHNPKKPPFQTPTNKASSLIANGWIEQQRRSKLRVVWKEVLASLVDGRKPGEDTTLWIQREYVNPSTGKMELEALHQIPIKLIRNIGYQEFTSDHRFLIKVHNMHEDFIFRCEKSEEAAQTWVTTIRSVIDILKEQKQRPSNSEKIPIRVALDQLEAEKRIHHQQQQQRPHSQQSIESSVSFDDEKKVPEHSHPTSTQYHPQQQHQQQHRVESPPISNGSTVIASNQTQPQPPQPQPHPTTSTTTSMPPLSQQQQQMSVTEMRAIAHGAGIQTHGLERGELERIVQQIALSIQTASSSGGGSSGAGVSPPPPQTSSTSSTLKPVPLEVNEESERQRKQQQQAAAANIERQQQIEEAARRRKLAEDAARSHAAAAAAATVEAQQQRQQALLEKQRAEEERKRLEAERLRRVEVEHQQRLAEQQAAEQRRRQEEQQRLQQEQWKQQQEQWQKQQTDDEQRRRIEEQRLMEEKRRQEEMYRAQHQQWQQQQQQAGVPPSQWQQHQQQQQQYPPGGPHPYGPGHPPGPHPGQPPPPHQQHQYQQQQHPGGNSQVDQKYATMATQVGDTEQRSVQIIKHGILVEWALRPPAMQILRPIELLITSVQTVFPPKYGVPGHEHFKKWTIVTLPEVMSGTQPDDEKLSKVVKKLRFVLHPDKLPRDFTNEQIFICRMVWDIVSDAFEDHKKKEEELAWMR